MSLWENTAVRICGAARRLSSLGPELGKTVRLALPIAIGQGGHGLMFLIDTVMAGRLGDTSLAAAAFAGNLAVLPFIFGLGLSAAIAVLTAQGRGMGHPEHGASALRHGLLIGGVFGVLVGTVIHCGVRTGALAHFGQDPEVVRMAGDFAILMGWGTLPGLLFQGLKNHREAVAQPWIALLWLCIGIVFNVLFNLVFMFGNLGAPALGLTGAGLGTLLARCVMFAGLAWHPGGQSPHWREGIQFKWLKASLVLGVPSAIQWVLEAGIFASAAVLMGHFSKEQQAAHQVAVSLSSLAFMIPLGISQGTSIRVGEAFGARDPVAMRRIAAGSLLFAAAFMGFYALIVIVFQDWIPLLYLSDDTNPGTVVFAGQFILIAAAFALCDGLQVVASGALRGMSDVNFTSISSFVCYWLVSVPIGLLLAYWGGLEGRGVWMGLACGILSAAVVLNCRLWLKIKAQEKKQAAAKNIR
ncbi:MAG: MATE family efflux transporter [Puniceicoccales bacterium]|jgi:MATE family multidrug resistance protein|nr:MATE family efflux transporter [Puniceicoccales bacterium]